MISASGPRPDSVLESSATGPWSASAAVLLATLGDIALRKDYRRRIDTSTLGELTEIGCLINALLDGFAEREAAARAREESFRLAWDDAQTANMLLRRVKDELKARKLDLDEALSKAAAASTAKSQFLANMSHEIRTPMNGILGTAELLARTPLQDRQKKHVDTIIRSGRALLTIINDILDFSKVESGKIELTETPFDLVACVNDIVALLEPTASRKQIALTADVQPGLPSSFCGDVGRIRQILTNITGNSVKFTDNGRVEVRLRGEVSDGACSLRIEVSDTGIGIPADKVNEVFEQFSQVDNTSARRHEGTGLGLAICRALIEQMGGRIGVESTLGVGSMFWIELRLPVHAVQPVIAYEEIDLRRHTVILVETGQADPSQLSSQLARLLGNLPLQCEAVQLLQTLESRAEGQAAVVVMATPAYDAGLLRQIETVRERYTVAEVSIVISTMVGAKGESESCKLAGAQAYFSEALTDNQLREVLQRALSRRANGTNEFVTRYSLAESAAIEPQSASNEAVQTDCGPQLGGKILLVEDSIVNQEVALEFLRGMDCRVNVAKNGQEAVAAFESEQFDAILMDCRMPIMDGFQATRAIRELEAARKCQATPIIALTANAFESDREKCYAAGMSDFISKPFMPDEFEATIYRWLRRSAIDRVP